MAKFVRNEAATQATVAPFKKLGHYTPEEVKAYNEAGKAFEEAEREARWQRTLKRAEAANAQAAAEAEAAYDLMVADAKALREKQEAAHKQAAEFSRFRREATAKAEAKEAAKKKAAEEAKKAKAAEEAVLTKIAEEGSTPCTTNVAALIAAAMKGGKRVHAC